MKKNTSTQYKKQTAIINNIRSQEKSSTYKKRLAREQKQQIVKMTALNKWRYASGW